VPHPQSNGLP